MNIVVADGVVHTHHADGTEVTEFPAGYATAQVTILSEAVFVTL